MGAIIRVGIIGQGRSGRNIHGLTLLKMPRKYKVVAISDQLPERRQRAEREALRLARFMWTHRELFVADLTPLEEAVRSAGETDGLTVFSDAADSTASEPEETKNTSSMSPGATSPIIAAASMDGGWAIPQLVE